MLRRGRRPIDDPQPRPPLQTISPGKDERGKGKESLDPEVSSPGKSSPNPGKQLEGVNIGSANGAS